MYKKQGIIFLLLFYCHFINAQEFYLFIGTYTGGKPDNGIYIYKFNNKSGELTEMSSGKDLINPSYLAVSPNGKFIYACTESKMNGPGSISAFSFDGATGKFTFINKQSSGGENPVYVSVHKSNKWLVSGNYTGGSVSVFPINTNGSLEPVKQLIQYSDSSVNKTRQEKAHVHSTVFSPDNNYLFIPDLGADKIRAYTFSEQKEQPLEKTEAEFYRTVPGSGPRHFTFHPNGKFAYCIEELSGTVSVYAYKNGKLDSVQRIAAHDSIRRIYGSADIHLSPDGKFLYASNRGEENNIAIFLVDERSGKLKLTGTQAVFGNHPRNFIIDPDGNYLLVANLVSNNVIVFRRNKKTGFLSKTGAELFIPHPSCLQFLKIKN